MNRITILIAISLAAIHSAWAKPIHITVMDEKGQPVEGALVVGGYLQNRPMPNDSDRVSAETDTRGKATLRGSTPMQVTLQVSKPGYYNYAMYGRGESLILNKRQIDAGVDLEITLRKKINPVPLFAKDYRASQCDRGLRIPEEKEWCGYDFEAGDWVKPHGSGQNADILFMYQKEFKGIGSTRNTSAEKVREIYVERFEREGRQWSEEYFRELAGKWDGVLEISFPGEKEGLLRVVEDYDRHSELRMPHRAPEKNYLSSYRYEEKSYAGTSYQEHMGFFLRTRVILDEHGKIKSANYSKVYGDFYFHPAGFVSFYYYFNPTPNDRNLEFDPKQNLFPDSVEGSNVILP